MGDLNCKVTDTACCSVYQHRFPLQVSPFPQAFNAVREATGRVAASSNAMPSGSFLTWLGMARTNSASEPGFFNMVGTKPYTLSQAVNSFIFDPVSLTIPAKSLQGICGNFEPVSNFEVAFQDFVINRID